MLFNFEGPEKDFQTVEHLWRYGGVAQLGEHLPCKQGVDSSNLFISTSRASTATQVSRMAKTVENRPQKWAHSSGG